MRPTKTFRCIDALAVLPPVGRRRLIATLVGCCTVMPTAAAQAQSDPGVTIDPGSPSAKEYGIPLEDARREADPSGSQSDRVLQGSRKSPRFGEGVSSPAEQNARGSAEGGSAEGGSGEGSSAGGGRGEKRSSAGGGRGETRSSAGGGRGEKRRGSSAEDRGSAGTVKSRRSRAAVVEAAAQPGAPSGGSSTALFVGIGGVVLGLGALGGLLLRRRTGA